MLKKPLIRWTIGNVSEDGFLCLKYSIFYWRKVFKDEFDLIVCYNQLSSEKVNFLKNLNVPLCDQSNFFTSFPTFPRKENWKFYPPRLNPDGHEIFVDNDLIIFNRPKIIDKFLQYNELFACYDTSRCYGQYDYLISPKIQINNGFFGFPPGYDFLKDVKSVFRPHFTFGDDQGLIAYVVCKNRGMVVSSDEIELCKDCDKTPTAKCGYHFVGMNRFTNRWFKWFIKNKVIKH